MTAFLRDYQSILDFHHRCMYDLTLRLILLHVCLPCWRLGSYPTHLCPSSIWHEIVLNACFLDWKINKRKYEYYRPCQIWTSDGDMSIWGEPSCCRELKMLPESDLPGCGQWGRTHVNAGAELPRHSGGPLRKLGGSQAIGDLFISNKHLLEYSKISKFQLELPRGVMAICPPFGLRV